MTKKIYITLFAALCTLMTMGTLCSTAFGSTSDNNISSNGSSDIFNQGFFNDSITVENIYRLLLNRLDFHMVIDNPSHKNKDHGHFRNIYNDTVLDKAYGSFSKILTARQYQKIGHSPKLYNGHISYGLGPVTTAISYFRASKSKDTIQSLTFVTDYKFMPGLSPYIEISHFKAKTSKSSLSQSPKKQIRGTVALIGAKLSF